MTRTDMITTLRTEAAALHNRHDFVADVTADRFTQAADILEADEKEINRLRVAAAEVEG